MLLNKSQNNLLEVLFFDQKKVDKELYSAGPYWDYKAKKIHYWLKKKGLKNFRGFFSGVGTSYTDNIAVNINYELGFKGRFVSKFLKLPFLRTIFKEQVNLNLNTTQAFLKYKQFYYLNNNKVNNLISKYKIEDTTEYGCETKVEINGKHYSMAYLDMCERIDNIMNFIKFNEIRSYMEIGGGFGANIHLILQNFKNIKKIVYIDIVPNLFVGTEYLRNFFGNSVKDYREFRNSNKIEFEKDDSLEIICLPPWKVSDLNSKIDSFHNSASFQEMTHYQVSNYYNYIKKNLKGGSISLIVYKGWQDNSTLSPKKINEIFENKLVEKEFSNFDKNDSNLVYLLSD